jgi:hypothetical protein
VIPMFQVTAAGQENCRAGFHYELFSSPSTCHHDKSQPELVLSPLANDCTASPTDPGYNTRRYRSCRAAMPQHHMSAPGTCPCSSPAGTTSFPQTCRAIRQTPFHRRRTLLPPTARQPCWPIPAAVASSLPPAPRKAVGADPRTTSKLHPRAGRHKTPELSS